MPATVAVEDGAGAVGWVVAAILAAVLLAGLLWVIRQWWLIQKLRAQAERLAAGELGDRGTIQRPGWARAFAVQLGRAAQLFESRYDAEARRRLELEAVYRSMIEGVLVLDLDQRVRSLNQAAARLLHVGTRRAVGRNVLEVVRDLPLGEFITRAMAAAEPIQDEIALRLLPAGRNGARAAAGAGGGMDVRLLEAQAAPMHDAAGARIGVVIVLHDVTHQRRLESLRRDFVANVSHEIKTPVTAIKAAVETIHDSPDLESADLEHFLAIVGRQADRLQAIIEDLLALARIEQDAEDARIELARGRIEPILRGAVETCQAKAEARGIAIDVHCEPALAAWRNTTLLEQAVVNLLDNAVKYSHDGGRIVLRAVTRGEEIVIEVADQGVGIAAEHLPRLFERFYRTDRARSRALGGTGLGLAIVKHITEAHAGRVSVESRPGVGSTFAIHLPAAAALTADLAPVKAG